MLTKEQIKTLQNYCAVKGVVYYDLEQEIVDHLASVVEDEQTQFPDKSFNEILENKAPEFSKDWKTIETEKRKTLRREYLREFGKEFMSYFTVPKILITIAAMIGTYLFLKIFQKNILNSIGLLINCTSIIVNTYYRKKNIEVKGDKDSRRYELISYNVFKKMNFLCSVILLLYLVAIFVTAFVFDDIKTLRLILDFNPLFFVSIMCLNQVRYSYMQKIKTNYPLAFQN